MSADPRPRCPLCQKNIPVQIVVNYVLEAVKKQGMNLEYASEEMKRDREVCLAAVAQNVGAIEYASKEMKNDREVCLAAVAQEGNALQTLAAAPKPTPPTPRGRPSTQKP